MKTNLDAEIGLSNWRAVLANVDAGLRAWALGQGSGEDGYPVLIAAHLLARAGYPDAFPHLLMSPAVVCDPAQPMAVGNMRVTEWCLSPAVCYHTYAGFEGRTLDSGVMVTARGHCFRNEDAGALAPGRRQIEFQMRELVLLGAEEWIEDRIRILQPGVEKLARDHGLEGSWMVANDPFFLPRAQGRAHVQRLRQTKLEWCLPDGLAVASINRHGTFFGERFHISGPDQRPAHTACIAFGLDRWAAHTSAS